MHAQFVNEIEQTQSLHDQLIIQHTITNSLKSYAEITEKTAYATLDIGILYITYQVLNLIYRKP